MDSSQVLEQINVRVRNLPHKALSKYITLALIIYLAYFVATMVWQLVPVTNSKGKVVSSALVQKSNSSSSSVDMSSLLKLNLFGEEGKVETVKPKPNLNKVAPKTRLNVTLTGLVADSSDPISQTSVAIIESSGGQDTYAIEDKVSGTNASIYQIFVDRVILLVSGRYETLMLDGIEYSTTPPTFADNKVKQESSNQAKLTTVAKKTTKKPVKSRSQLDKRQNMELAKTLREQREQLFSDPKKLLDVIRIRPYKPQGKLEGYRLSPGKDAKLFNEVGLKRNDLAVSINGNDLTDMQQALAVMAELKSMTEATITVVREEELIDIILAL